MTRRARSIRASPTALGTRRPAALVTIGRPHAATAATRCCIMEVNAAFMASYGFATRWQEGASAHDYDEGHYGANEGLPRRQFL